MENYYPTCSAQRPALVIFHALIASPCFHSPQVLWPPQGAGLPDHTMKEEIWSLKCYIPFENSLPQQPSSCYDCRFHHYGPIWPLRAVLWWKSPQGIWIRANLPGFSLGAWLRAVSVSCNISLLGRTVLWSKSHRIQAQKDPAGSPYP